MVDIMVDNFSVYVVFLLRSRIQKKNTCKKSKTGLNGLFWGILPSHIFVWLRSWNEDHITITRWSLCVDIDPHFSGSLLVYFW